LFYSSPNFSLFSFLSSFPFPCLVQHCFPFFQSASESAEEGVDVSQEDEEALCDPGRDFERVAGTGRVGAGADQPIERDESDHGQCDHGQCAFGEGHDDFGTHN